MKNYFIYLLFLVSVLTACKTDEVVSYESPLNYPTSQQIIYKLNKAEDIYWRLIDVKTTEHIDALSFDILLKVPTEWHSEIKQMAIELYLNKVGE